MDFGRTCRPTCCGTWVMTLAKRRFCIEVEFTVNTESAPLLFLDFDGVTHPEPCGSAPLFQSLPQIEAVLRRYPGVLVALSTTRRVPVCNHPGCDT